jgi:membrane protein YdbS with pleckstrin-like domain
MPPDASPQTTGDRSETPPLSRDSDDATAAPSGSSQNGSSEKGSPHEERTHEERPDAPAALPDRFADGTMKQLEPGIRTIWMLKTGGALLLLVAGVFFYEFVQWLSGDAGRWPFVLTAVLGAASVALAVGVPRLRYRYWRYALRTEELYLEHGVFNRVRTVVPLRRIQHLDVSQDLFEREFDLGKLIVHTAGGRSSDVAVPGLRYETAEQLRDDVKHYVLDHTL